MRERRLRRPEPLLELGIGHNGSQPCLQWLISACPRSFRSAGLSSVSCRFGMEAAEETSMDLGWEPVALLGHSRCIIRVWGSNMGRSMGTYGRWTISEFQLISVRKFRSSLSSSCVPIQLVSGSISSRVERLSLSSILPSFFTSIQSWGTVGCPVIEDNCPFF